MSIFALFLPLYRKTSPQTYNKPYFGFILGINGLFGIQNMGIDTKILAIPSIWAKIWQNTEIAVVTPAAILNHDVRPLVNTKIVQNLVFSNLYTPYLFFKP